VTVLYAEMSAGDVAAIIMAVIAAVLVAFVCVALVALTKTMATLRETIEQLRRETLPVVVDLQGTVHQANAELERVDGILGTAESISATVDSASRLAYLALSNPVIKVLAFSAGTARASRRFRRRRGL
jgi:uncharacterized protein YoxC